MTSLREAIVKGLCPWFEKRDLSDSPPPWYGRYRHASQILTRNRNPGDLFERLEETSWDWLIILDACRFDFLAAIVESVVVDSAVSPATQTAEFLRKANARGVFSDSVYVSAHVKPSKVDPGAHELVSVHEDAWDDELHTCPPLPALSRSFERLGSGNPVVTHLLQPHWPHVVTIEGKTRPVPGGLHPRELGGGYEQNFYKILLTEMSKPGGFRRAKESYRVALRSVWSLVETCAFEASAEGHTVAVTADHGELLGEWGFVSHPAEIRIDPLVTVPWVVFDGDTRDGAESVDSSIREKLQSLGYVE